MKIISNGILASLLGVTLSGCMSNELVEETYNLMMSLECGISRHDAYEIAYGHGMEFHCGSEIGQGTCSILRYGQPPSTIYAVGLEFDPQGKLVRADTVYLNISFIPYTGDTKVRELCNQ